MNAQDNQLNIPYATIPKSPEQYSEGAVTARLIDGLGFRYYWASEGLRKDDLKFRPAHDVRSMEEIIDHILDLSTVIVNSAQKKTHKKIDYSNMDFLEKRSLTLNNIKLAADIFKDNEKVNSFKIIFGDSGNKREFPFWNLINGPVSDALWHCGQIVTYRRLSGNPINPKVNVFSGRLND